MQLKDTMVKTTEDFNVKLVFSGYKLLERTRIIDGGLTAFRNKLKQHPDPAQFYKNADQTAARRNRAKLLAKTSWYKGWKPIEERGKVTQWQPGSKEKRKTAKNQELEVAAGLFVPRTGNSDLAMTLRAEETKIASHCKYRIKIVERAGTKLQDLLTA